MPNPGQYWDDELDPSWGQPSEQEPAAAPGTPGYQNPWGIVFNPATASSTSAKSPNQLLAESNNPMNTPNGPTVAQQQAASAAATGQTATPTTANGAGNSTAGTTPPVSPLSGNVPAYAAQYTNYAWMNSPVVAGAPGANTQVATPGTMAQYGVNYDSIPQYDANGVLIPTWENPNTSSAAGYQALNEVLTGDASGMDVSAIKNRLKEQALQMQKDTMTSSRQAAANRGMLDSGYQQSQERRIGNETQKNILGNFRSTDEKAAENATANRIAASAGLSSLVGQDYTNADTAHAAALAAATQQDTQNQFAATHGLDVEEAQRNAYVDENAALVNAANQNLESWNKGNEATEQARQDDLDVARARTTELIARLGLAVNLEEIAQADTNTKMGFLVDIFGILVQQQQANAQLGLNYAQLGMTADQLVTDVAKSIGVGA